MNHINCMTQLAFFYPRIQSDITGTIIAPGTLSLQLNARRVVLKLCLKGRCGCIHICWRNWSPVVQLCKYRPSLIITSSKVLNSASDDYLKTIISQLHWEGERESYYCKIFQISFSNSLFLVFLLYIDLVYWLT